MSAAITIAAIILPSKCDEGLALGVIDASEVVEVEEEVLLVILIISYIWACCRLVSIGNLVLTHHESL